jgi:TetR/AcrR family transcriptional repressor of nem operon
LGDNPEGRAVLASARHAILDQYDDGEASS